MSLLRTAVEHQKWDLAAYVIVLAVARVLGRGEKNDGRKKEGKKENKH